jgi:hypothetical protein
MLCTVLPSFHITTDELGQSCVRFVLYAEAEHMTAPNQINHLHYKKSIIVI